MLKGQILFRYCAGNLSHCEFRGTLSMPYPEDKISHHSSQHGLSYILSVLSSVIFPMLLISMSILGLTSPLLPILSILTSYEPLIKCHPLQKEASYENWEQHQSVNINIVFWSSLKTCPCKETTLVDFPLGPIIATSMRFLNNFTAPGINSFPCNRLQM